MINNETICEKESQGDDTNTIISIEMAEELIHAAMTKLPIDLTAAYKEACRFAPELIQKESDPRWFLRFHQHDAHAAAIRLTKYWMKRKEVFEELAFLPINLTGTGAMTRDDVKLLQTGYFVNLPCDANGRSILYVDPSKKSNDIPPPLRLTFFIAQCIMENIEASQRYGAQFLFNVSNPFVDNVHMPNVIMAKHLVDECMPITSLRFHVIYVPPPGTKVDQTFINTNYTQRVNQLGGIFGHDTVIVHITSSKKDCLQRLIQYDMSSHGLPVGLGGSWAQGCEPWRRRRKGGGHDVDDELTLEIELDLSCLLRTTLWTHQQQQTTVINNNEIESSSPPLDDSKMPPVKHRKMAATKDPLLGVATTVSTNNQNRQQQDGGSYTLAARAAPIAAAASTVPSINKPRQLTQQEQEEDKKLHPWRYETSEQREKRRQRVINYGKTMRKKQKSLMHELIQQRHHLTFTNNTLRDESERLHALQCQAQQEIERISSISQEGADQL